MFKEISIKETFSLLRHAGSFAPDSCWDMSLSIYPTFYRIYRAFQYSFFGEYQDLTTQLTASRLPEIPDDWKITVVMEMTTGCTISQLKDIHSWAEAYSGNKLERFEPVFLYGEAFVARITVIHHDTKRRRSFNNRINCQSRLLHDMDQRVARIIDDEYRRNSTARVARVLDPQIVIDLLYRQHFLWTDIANSTTSASDIVKRFRPEMERVMNEFDIVGLILFIEVDSDFTTKGEVDTLKRNFMKLVGKDARVVVNHRIRDSFIKSITCRAVLIGSPKYKDGEVYYDFDYRRYEILLYGSDNKKWGHIIVASFSEDKKLTLSRYDWGDFEHNSKGQTDEHHLFDESATEALRLKLKVKTPQAMLRTIRKRFASRLPSCADMIFLRYCQNNEIGYKSSYYF